MTHATRPLARIATRFAAALATGLLATAPADAGVFDATLVEDTYLEASNSTNYASSSTLNFRTHTSVWRNPLMQFSLPVLNPAEQVVKVELILTSASDPSGTGGTPDIEVVATTTSIDMGTVTYNSAQTDGLHTGGEDFTSALLWSNDWDDFSSESVIPGADFFNGQTITYMDDNAGGMLAFIQNAISTSTNETVNFGLGFVLREGNSGTTSLGWTIHSQEGTTAPILRITTAPIPEPATLGLVALGGLAMLGRRR